MASKTIVNLVDDLDGTEATQTVKFGLDGVHYTIDLNDENAQDLRDRLADHVTAGRRIAVQRAGRTYNKATVSETRAVNQAIREWAREQGDDVSARGRIPAELVERYKAAHAHTTD